MPSCHYCVSDKSFTFITKKPPVAELLKKAAGVEKGSAVPNRDKVAKSQEHKHAKLQKKKCKI